MDSTTRGASFVIRQFGGMKCWESAIGNFVSYRARKTHMNTGNHLLRLLLAILRDQRLR